MIRVREGQGILKNKSRSGVGAGQAPGNRFKNSSSDLTVNENLCLTIQNSGSCLQNGVRQVPQLLVHGMECTRNTRLGKKSGSGGEKAQTRGDGKVFTTEETMEEQAPLKTQQYYLRHHLKHGDYFVCLCVWLAGFCACGLYKCSCGCVDQCLVSSSTGMAGQ